MQRVNHWMKHVSHPFLTLVLAALSICLFSGCQTSGSGTTARVANVPPSPDILRVGITPSLPPMVYKTGAGYEGIEVDMAHQLATRMSRRAVFVEVPWEQQIPALLENKTDIIMSSMSITPARQVRISFSRPYMRSGQVALVRREDLSKLQLFLFSEKYKIGTQKGTTGDFYVQLNLAKASRVTFDDPEKGAQALIRKKIDAFVIDGTLSWWLASKYEAEGLTVIPKVLTEELLGWGLRKSDAQIQETVNAFLMESEQSGMLVNLIRKWIPNFGQQGN